MGHPLTLCLPGQVAVALVPTGAPSSSLKKLGVEQSDFYLIRLSDSFAKAPESAWLGFGRNAMDPRMDLAADTHLGRVQSLVRAFALLDELANCDAGLSLTEIAKRVGLPRSTAHRLLTTMDDLSYVDFQRDTNRWQVGAKAMSVGNAFMRSRDLGKIGQPIMRSLAVDYKETVNISIPDGKEIKFVAQVPAKCKLRTNARPGVHLPMHLTASGKAVLAYLEAPQINQFLLQRMSASTAYTITDPSRIQTQLSEIRKRGYALDDQESAVGVRCVAAPVLDGDLRVLGALSLSGPASTTLAVSMLRGR
ncbi:IclR family transcriptional regulator [Sphingobium sp. H39-3-25]|nr:IclR family transcriptional regulator [Sphingobium arseniciresistens]